MTRPSVYARRLSRGVFGTVLLLGALAMFAIPAHAPIIVAMTWGLGLLLGGLTRLVAADHDADDLAAFGLAMPLVGIAAIGPLSLHLLVAVALGGTDGFDSWVLASLLATAVAHPCFIVCSAVYGCQLATGRRTLTQLRIYVYTVLASIVPLGWYFLIVPAVITVTSPPFLWILGAFERLAARERAELAAPRLPVAVVRAR